MANPQIGIQLKEMNEKMINTSDRSALNKSQNPKEEQTMVPENDQINRPSTRGAYRPIRNGTIQGSIFAMLASALGTGCLNLPLRVEQLGIIPFIMVTLICAFLSYLGMYMMECIIIKYKVVSYSQMVKKAYGSTIMRFSQTILIGYAWAIAICFQVILAKFVVQILADALGMDLYEDRSRQIYNFQGEVVRVIVSVLNLALNYKNFFLTDLSEMLNSLGKFSVTGVVFCMAFIVITAFMGFTKYQKKEEIIYNSIFTMSYQHVQLFKPYQDGFFRALLQGVSGIFYIFLNHQFIFPVISHLKRPSKKRVQRIFITAHIQAIIIYITMGLLGYLLLSQHIDIVPISPLVITSIPTIPLMLGKIMLSAALFFALPLQIFTAREYLYQALDIQRNEQNLQKLNIWVIGSSFLIGVVFQKVNMYFGFIGGTTGCMMATIIPLACLYKLIKFTPYHQAIAVFGIIMSAILFTGAIQSLFSPV